MYVLIGIIIAFFTLVAAATLPANSGFRDRRPRPRRVPGDAGIVPISLSERARYDSCLCTRE